MLFSSAILSRHWDSSAANQEHVIGRYSEVPLAVYAHQNKAALMTFTAWLVAWGRVICADVTFVWVLSKDGRRETKTKIVFFFIYNEKTAWKCVSANVSTVVLLTAQVYSLIFGTHLGE